MSNSRARREAVRESANVKKHNQPRRIWPAVLAILGLALLAIAGWTLFKDPASVFLEDLTSSGTPALKVDQERVDVGDVKLGQTVEVTLKLTNVGTKTLRFNKEPYIQVVEGCWPPTPTIGTMALKPGETTKLQMRFLMHGDMGGKHNFLVHLLTNDPAQPDHTVAVLSNWIQ